MSFQPLFTMLALSLAFLATCAKPDKSAATRPTAKSQLSLKITITYQNVAAPVTTLDRLDQLSGVHIAVEGAAQDQIAVGLVPSFNGLFLTRNLDGTPVPGSAPAKGLPFYLSADSLTPGTYAFNVVARDRGACLARDMERPDCEDGRRIQKVIPGIDQAQPLTIILKN